METSLISTLNILFWICLIFAVVFFIISIVLFFVFDIKSIFDIRTGRAKAKSIKEMESANEKTGRLTGSGKLSEKKSKKLRKAEVTPPSEEFINRNYNDTANVPTAEKNLTNVPTAEQKGKAVDLTTAETNVLGGAPDVEGANETEVLNVEKRDPDETEVLRDYGADDNGTGETEVLSNKAAQAADESGAGETEVLSDPGTDYSPSGETAVLNDYGTGDSGAAETENIGSGETEVLSEDKAHAMDSGVTQVLDGQPDDRAQRTKELNNVRSAVSNAAQVAGGNNFGKTEKLSGQQRQKAAAEIPKKKPAVGFTVVKKDVYIHTNEKI